MTRAHEHDLAIGTWVLVVVAGGSYFDGQLGRVMGPAQDGEDLLVQIPGEHPMRFGRGSLVVAAPAGAVAP